MISDHRFVALICRNDFNKIFDKKVVKSKNNVGHKEGPNVHISGAHRGHIVVNTERNMIPIFAASLQMFFLHKYIVTGAGFSI